MWLTPSAALNGSVIRHKALSKVQAYSSKTVGGAAQNLDWNILGQDNY